MPIKYYFRISSILLFWVQSMKSMSVLNKQNSDYFLDISSSESDIANIIISKGYLPNEKDLSKVPLLRNVHDDGTLLLSKLSDEELIKLLYKQPKKDEFDLNDIIKVLTDPQNVQSKELMSNIVQTKAREILNDVIDNNKSVNKRLRPVSNKNKLQTPVFRLNNKQVDPYNLMVESDPNYVAFQKLNNLLFSRPRGTYKDDETDENTKELLFDVLVTQLKALCCKSSKKGELKNTFINSTGINKRTDEYIFLIINDDIKSNRSDEVISVDPDSLGRNSSVLLLGPIATPLTDVQLKLVMNRISRELSKPEYIPLLQQLSDGVINDNSIKLMDSLIMGPETRRYIKPHRCNPQSKLAKVYGGPKWLICTGYLNLNMPSLYD